ncbi:hypothetical protein I553_1428 [Mycobacterium xenopi 4042]|uniref:Uncharacterized protein n=1 Tax=Mycobacterium xenopi 4042 TaxID=1299334 RepID=X8CFK3_MYCXE|nr:hypothetical protein I553_1428 [Mycobacterium xenopi 4042]
MPSSSTRPNRWGSLTGVAATGCRDGRDVGRARDVAGAGCRTGRIVAARFFSRHTLPSPPFARLRPRTCRAPRRHQLQVRSSAPDRFQLYSSSLAGNMRARLLLLVVVKPAGRGGMQALQIGHDPAVGRASSGRCDPARAQWGLRGTVAE